MQCWSLVFISQLIQNMVSQIDFEFNVFLAFNNENGDDDDARNSFPFGF